jgi:hypothetical protein
MTTHRKIANHGSSRRRRWWALDSSVVHNYTLENVNKSIHEAYIKIDCGPVGFECLGKAFNEGQSECWCVIVSIALALIK